MNNEYFIEQSCKIDKLMWVFCKSNDVKQKKQAFCVKQTESFPRADVNALRRGLFVVAQCFPPKLSWNFFFYLLIIYLEQFI